MLSGVDLSNDYISLFLILMVDNSWSKTWPRTQLFNSAKMILEVLSRRPKAFQEQIFTIYVPRHQWCLWESLHHQSETLDTVKFHALNCVISRKLWPLWGLQSTGKCLEVSSNSMNFMEAISLAKMNWRRMERDLNTLEGKNLNIDQIFDCFIRLSSIIWPIILTIKTGFTFFIEVMFWIFLYIIWNYATQTCRF